MKIKQLWCFWVCFESLVQNHFRYIIQGAGASGLWLAHSLSEAGLLEVDQLLIIEGDANKVNDRTWCFWGKAEEHNFPFVDAKWPSLKVQGNVQSIAPYQYCHARSEGFYRGMREALLKNTNVFWLNEWVNQATAVGQCVNVQTNQHNLTADYFFGSGQWNSKIKLGDIALWQSFVGWRVRLINQSWEANAATLMDFSIPQSNSTRFLYVLPLNSCEGLVEVTQFHPERLLKEEGEAILQQICQERGWEVEVLEVECDAIPMSPAFNQLESHHNAGARIIEIGISAGALKPTTGYGFLTMRNHALQIARALKTGNPLPRIYRKRRFRFYDALLLQMLEENPHRGKDIFERLFNKLPARLVLKFLDEKTAIWEEIRIFSQLQIAWFLKAVFQYAKR